MNTRDAVRTFVLESFLFTNDTSALVDADSLTEKGIVDSMGALEIATFIEDTFGFPVAEDEMLPENLDSVDRIVAYVERKQKVAAA